jgi:hypothetical protein
MAGASGGGGAGICSPARCAGLSAVDHPTIPRSHAAILRE